MSHNKVGKLSFKGDKVSKMSKLEILDELEEWHLLAAHYCIAWAYKVIDESQKLLYDKVRFVDYRKKERKGQSC